VLYETLRLHPPVTIIPKMALEDTYLPDDVYPLASYSATKDTGTAEERPRVFIPKGTHVHIDTTALREFGLNASQVNGTDEGAPHSVIQDLHRKQSILSWSFSYQTSYASSPFIASHWEDPSAFKPERFLEDYNKDAFLPFSGGARGASLVVGAHHRPSAKPSLSHSLHRPTFR
jgi:hypothetical protein